MKHGSSLSSINKHGLTPLHWAASNGQAMVVQNLLAHGVQFDAVDNLCATPLHHAAWHKRGEVVKNGDTPLHLASINDHLDIVEEKDPTKDRAHRHPVASIDDQAEVLQLLLNASANRLLRNK
ncbi:unnamed protein product, partial [Aphanomyces euteiches]